MVEANKVKVPYDSLIDYEHMDATTSESWDSDPLLLGTHGGTMALESGQLRPAAPGD